MRVLHLSGVLLPAETEADLWIADGVLHTQRPEVPASQIETIATSGWVLPGLVDTHCHIGLGTIDGREVATPADAKALAMIDRGAGVLTMRDNGSPFDYSELDEDPEMPRLVRAGRHLSAPRRYLRGLAVECTPQQFIAQAGEQALRGSGWIKIVGDWIERETGDLTPVFDDETVAAAVAAAHAAGARVAVHTFSEAALPGLIAAGVDSIEHGTGLARENIDAMASSGIALVPTLINIATFDDIADGAARFPRYAEHMRALKRNFPAVVRDAYDAGIAIYAGTDAGGGIAHGRIADEVDAMVQVGIPAADAVAAASWRARAFLGFDGLVDGAPADLCVYDADPRVDPSVLRRPTRIVLRGTAL